MFLTEEKLSQRIEEIRQYRYREVQKIPGFQVKEDVTGLVNPEVPQEFEGWDVLQTGDRWSARDRYLWMHTRIYIPKQWNGKRTVGLFDFGRCGAGLGFEAMCYLNGEPYQGVDSNHKEVFFPETCYGKEFDLVFRFWSGLEEGGIPQEQEHKIYQAEIAVLDGAADDFYFMGKAMLDTICLLEKDSPMKYQLKSALNKACNCIDWSYPGNEKFYESVDLADELLNKAVDGMDKQSLVKVSCVGHTHIDMAWLWRMKHTREKASRSFSTVLRMMEMFPEYIFLQSQPQLYEYVKEDFPQIYENIKSKVNEGRWEADGGMWIEADCNLTGGESLTRQLLLGSKFFREEFGKEPQYLWLPDVFGYSWALPQILKKSGIDVFLTTKISWNQFNRMPHDTFVWRGMDGSEVLTHFITTPEPGRGKDSWFATYNGVLTPETVKGVWDAYQDKELNKNLLIAFGYGDGGGGVNRDLLEARRRLAKIPGLPEVEMSSAGEYFRNLKEAVENTEEYVHTWDGELYLEFHRGTYTSQGYNKRMNRKMEILYRKAEWLIAMHAVRDRKSGQAEQKKLTAGWKLLLTNQFHDIIPGSSIHEVYEDSRKDYEIIEKTGRAAVSDAVDKELQQEETRFRVYNALTWKSSAVVEIPDGEDGMYYDCRENALSSQKENGKYYVKIDDVPGMGFSEISYKKGVPETPESIFKISGKQVETPFYVLAFNDYGQIIRLYDKHADREVLAKGERGNVLQVFEDKPLANEVWDIEIYYQEKMREITDLTEFSVVENGPLWLGIQLVWKYINTTISQKIKLYNDSRRIDFETEVDFHERQQLIKTCFPVNIRTTFATYDIQYGNVRRPNHWNTSWDYARFEVVGHRFADLSEQNYGVALLNDCKYGYDIKGNVMRLSLLRSGLKPDYEQDQGKHVFTYALFPHEGDFAEGQVVQEASLLNDPMEVRKGKGQQEESSFIDSQNSKVEIDAVKLTEDGKYLLCRFHEFAGSTQQIKLKTSFKYEKWAESDLMERPTGEFTQGPVNIKISPYEIKTILFAVCE